MFLLYVLMGEGKEIPDRECKPAHTTSPNSWFKACFVLLFITIKVKGILRDFGNEALYLLPQMMNSDELVDTIFMSVSSMKEVISSFVRQC